tara:strand:- start:719 stop:1045 length:327 start_codon:yes stop_codon:yes gene_type:complete
MMKGFAFGLLMLGVVSSTAANAEGILAGADLEYGESLAADCVVCHNQNSADRGVPNINGLSAEAFASTLTAYKTGELDNPLKKMIASKLDAKQIASLAVYFASLPKGQ